MESFAAFWTAASLNFSPQGWLWLQNLPCLAPKHHQKPFIKKL
jgi:hypothetical protein